MIASALPYGYVYVECFQPLIDEYVKIGSTNSPRSRLTNFNSSSPIDHAGVFWQVADYEQWECRILDALEPFRHPDRSEMFSVECVSAIHWPIDVASNPFLAAFAIAIGDAIGLLTDRHYIRSYLVHAVDQHKGNHQFMLAYERLIQRSLVIGKPYIPRPLFGRLAGFVLRPPPPGRIQRCVPPVIFARHLSPDKIEGIPEKMLRKTEDGNFVTTWPLLLDD